MKSQQKEKKALTIYFLTFGGIIIWLGLILLAPYLKSQSLRLNVLVYTIFSPICHQISSRSLFLFGHPLAVCSRCFGIYFGFLIGFLLYPLLKRLSNTTLPKTRIFIFISSPIVFDTLGNFFRLWITPNIPRFIIGFLWGIILPFFFIVGIIDLFTGIRSKNKAS